MIRHWLKQLFIEALREYEDSGPSEIIAFRDPASADIKKYHRPGLVWTNQDRNNTFYLDLVWKKKSGRKKKK